MRGQQEFQAAQNVGTCFFSKNSLFSTTLLLNSIRLLHQESNLEKALESIGLGLKEQNQETTSSVVKFINDDNATSERKGYGLTIELSCHDALAVSVTHQTNLVFSHMAIVAGLC